MEKKLTKEDLLKAMEIMEKNNVPRVRNIIITQYWAIRCGLVRKKQLRRGQRYQVSRKKTTYRIGDMIIVPDSKMRISYH